MLKTIGLSLFTIALAFLVTVGMAFAQVEGSLGQVGGSGVTGDYSLEATDSQTRVTVNLEGLDPNTSHVGHIHSGTCANLGDVVVPLSTITGDNDGIGSMTTTINLSLSDIQGENHAISYHEGSSLPSPTISCADIPRDEGSEVTPVPDREPSTGLGGTSK